MSEARKGVLARAAGLYMRLIEYFIPEKMRADPEAANQARMFLISHSMGPILGNAVPLAILLFNPTVRIDAVVLMITITCFWVFPFLLRMGLRYDVLVLTSVVNLNFCILWSCYFYGGVSSPTLPWLLIIPILSLFYVGGERRLQPALLAISAGSFALFLEIYKALPPPPLDMPLFAFRGLGVVSTTAALCYVATMAVYYARIFDSGIKLEGEVRRRRAKTDELREAIALADRAASAKAEFLARMGHELRNPLNAVIGYSQILGEDAKESGSETMRLDVERIHEAGEYLLRLINMILDLAKLEAGRMVFNVAPHHLSTIIANVFDCKKDLIEANGNIFSVDIEPGSECIELDGGRLSQILEAIVENAAQHTRDGRITVAARTHDAGDHRVLVVAVEDTGKGIDPTALPTLFQTFSATRDAATGRYGGTGLNLTVVYRLCTAMGGAIDVASQLGKGSCFTITLPLQNAGAQTQSAPPVQTATSTSIAA
jgi:signal transduction histidine kinase